MKFCFIIYTQKGKSQEEICFYRRYMCFCQENSTSFLKTVLDRRTRGRACPPVVNSLGRQKRACRPAVMKTIENF